MTGSKGKRQRTTEMEYCFEPELEGWLAPEQPASNGSASATAAPLNGHHADSFCIKLLFCRKIGSCTCIG